MADKGATHILISKLVQQSNKVDPIRIYFSHVIQLRELVENLTIFV